MFCSKCGVENAEGAKFCSKCGIGLSIGATPIEAEAEPEAETTVGISPNLAGFLCYVAGGITGIVFVLLEKKNRFVKFHAWQSIMTFLVLTVVQIVLSTIIAPIVLYEAEVLGEVEAFYVVSSIRIIVWLIIVGLWIALMIRAYQGRMWKVPGAGDWAEKQASK
jgi:uncharacterized membrane protein